MASYLMLGHYTDKGITSIHDGAERLKRFKELCQAEGAKVISYYLLMGRYDVACVIEAPSAEVMAKIALIVGKRGNVRTETMCAFTDREQADLIAKIAQNQNN